MSSLSTFEQAGLVSQSTLSDARGVNFVNFAQAANEPGMLRGRFLRTATAHFIEVYWVRPSGKRVEAVDQKQVSS